MVGQKSDGNPAASNHQARFPNSKKPYKIQIPSTVPNATETGHVSMVNLRRNGDACQGGKCRQHH
jgi:hypothetical protein